MATFTKIAVIHRKAANQISIRDANSDDSFDMSQYVGKALFIESDALPLTEPAATVAQRLRLAMDKSGSLKSQYALANASGVPQPTIKRILDGNSMEPKRTTLTLLARHLDVSLEWLRDGDTHNATHGHEWQNEGDLLYVLKNGENFFEVNVAMANGSRKPADREAFAKTLLTALQSMTSAD